VASIGSEIGNTPLALLFLIGALYRYVVWPAGPYAAATIGLAIGLATTMKLNFALYAVPFGLFLAFRFGLRSREALNYAAGGLVGSCLIWYYMAVDFSHFWFFNIRFHELANLQREADGRPLTRLFTLAVLFFTLYACPALYFIYKAWRITYSPEKRRRFLELSGLLATSLIAAFAPGYGAPQYLAAPCVILAIGLSLSMRDSVREATPALRKRSWAVIILPAAWVIPFWIGIFPFSLQSLVSAEAAPLQLRKMRERIDAIATAHLQKTSCEMTAVSLSPVPLLGTAFSLSSGSASGPFLPIVSAQLKKHAPDFAHYGSITEELALSQPTAILAGYYPDRNAERNLLQYADEFNFTAFDVGTLPGYTRKRPQYRMQLLVRKSCMSGSALRNQSTGFSPITVQL
jgi:hypothetical protein